MYVNVDNVREVVTLVPASKPRLGGRSARVVAATYAAAAEILGEVGYERLQLVDVAARADVHKSTVYRRWPTKSVLVGELLAHFALQHVTAPDTGSLRSDLERLLAGIAAALEDRPIRAVLRAAVSLDETDETRTARDGFWEERFRLSGVIVERAIARGEIQPDTDARTLLEMAASPIYFRTLLTDEPVDRELIAQFAARTVQAFGTT